MFNPLLIVGAAISTVALIFIIAFALMKNKKEAIGFERYMKDSELIKRLLVYVKPHGKTFLLVGFIVALSIAYDIAAPYLIGRIEELVKGSFALYELYILVAVYAVFLVISLISTYAQAMILKRTGERILSKLREDLFAHIESMSHAQLTKEPVGKLVTRVASDTNHISNLFVRVLVDLFKNAFLVVGVLIAMFCLNIQLTLMVLCFVPFIVLFTLIFRKFSRRAYRRVRDRSTDINIYLSENLTGMKVTQIFNQEGRKQREFREKSSNLCKARHGQTLVFGTFRPLVYMLYISSVLCLFYLGGKGYLDHTTFMGQALSGGVIVSFYMYLSKFFNPIQALAEQFNLLQASFASAEKVFTVFDIAPDVVDAPDAIELPEVRGEITFEHVWFSYIPGEWVLKDVSFHIPAGDTAAFVGQTGSGKSTILSLLCRNYDVQKGRILVDGIDIRTVKIASLRRQFGQMLQDVFLFSGTIRSNIVLRAEGITDDEVWDACHYVNADGFISRTQNGLDEIVRENGNNFSAGQRQLISFARTIVHKPRVMILDEATANIDTETEILIQDSLEKMMQIGTMLVVAHRLSTIQNADRIFLLSHGEIVEQGSHAELLAQGGRYYRLYQMQDHRRKLSEA